MVKIKIDERILAFLLAVVLLFPIFSFIIAYIQMSLPHTIYYKTDGYYYYIIDKSDEIDGKFVRIMGLTDSGKEQETLIIPETISGYPVLYLGQSTDRSGIFVSDNLQRVFIPNYVRIYASDKFFNWCPNLKQVFVTNLNYNINDNYRYLYFPSCQGLRYSHTSHIRLANVSYFYNYDEDDDDLNQGFYWIDYYDYGEKIELTAPTPTRDGYEFGGWFKEAECVNEWNFDVDVLPPLITEEDYEMENGLDCDEVSRDLLFVCGELYQETKLYAKWIAV